MATGIQTGIRRGALARQRRRRLVGGFILLLGLGLLAPVAVEQTRDPLERQLRRALNHALEGRDYRVALTRQRTGPVLVREAPVRVVVSLYSGDHAQREAVSQLVGGLLVSERGDHWEIVNLKALPPTLGLYHTWNCLASLGLALAGGALAYRVRRAR